MTLTVRNLEKRFAERLLFAGVNFTVGPGRKVALIGPNGSGKTTLLNMIGGTEEYDNGSLEERLSRINKFNSNKFTILTKILFQFDNKVTALQEKATQPNF